MTQMSQRVYGVCVRGAGTPLGRVFASETLTCARGLSIHLAASPWAWSLSLAATPLALWRNTIGIRVSFVTSAFTGQMLVVTTAQKC